jgi:hypothetical protein
MLLKLIQQCDKCLFLKSPIGCSEWWAKNVRCQWVCMYETVSDLLCVYVSVWICECVNVCVCIVVCVWEYVWVWGCVYVSVCVWVYVSVCGVFGCIVWMWLWLCECVYVCEYKCICLWVCLVLFKLCIGFTINIVLLPFWYDFKTVKIMFNFKIAILPNFFLMSFVCFWQDRYKNMKCWLASLS